MKRYLKLNGLLLMRMMLLFPRYSFLVVKME